jgi:hypothetical protein
MSASLTVVDPNPIKQKIIQNLIDCDGKEVAVLHAIRNIDNIYAALSALADLVSAGLVERRVIYVSNHGNFEFCRYRTELDLLRKYENS